MTEAGKSAVFLSYASQDAEAARRICEALRAEGVEVWFDQNELVGGDAWDAKIRKQIKDCALFVPIISASTQARLEGYFRVEWKLAAQRTHAMAAAKAFLLPVVIDATRDAEAHVPEEFLSVQWTRLPGGEAPDKFCARVRRLLGSEAEVVGRVLRTPPFSSSRGAEPARFGDATLQPPTSRRTWLVPTAAVLAAVVALALWQPWRAGEKTVPSGAMASVPKAAPAAAGAAEIAQVRAKMRPDEWTRADFNAFAPITDRLIKDYPENGEAWALRSIAHSLLVIRNLDTGTKPLETGKEAADRALRLAPDSPLAELSLGMHLIAMISRGGDVLASRPHIEKGLAGLPAEPLTRYADLCSFWLGYQMEGADRSARAWLAAEPAASFPAWILAQSYVMRRQPAEAVKWAEQASADPDVTGVRALVTLFEARYYLQGDLVAARAALDRVPAAKRGVHRVLASRFLLAMAERRFDVALQELARVPEAMLLDRVYHGPKALLSGEAHHAAGSAEVAQEQFRESERVLRQELASDPENLELRAVLALNLAWLGRADEARRELAAVEPLMRGQSFTVYSGQIVALIAQSHGVLGDAKSAVTWLRRMLTESISLPFTPASLRLDPRYARVLESAEIKALLAELASKEHVAGTAATEKTLAVLAFDNRSDDKETEYFSDGVSDELIAALQRVPGLTVKGRTSAFFFKGKQVKSEEIGRQLGVAYLVRGSVRKAGNSVRITAELTRAASDEVVWSSEPITKELKDVLAVQEEIAALIAKSLSLKLGMKADHGSVPEEAYRLVLQARFFAQRMNTEGWNRAVGHYRQAIDLKQDYGLAWGELARCYTLLARYDGIPFAEGFREARVAAERALAIQPDLAVGHDAMGWVQRTVDRNWSGAEKSFRRALALAPQNGGFVGDLAVVVHNQGRLPEAIDLARRAVELDPLNAGALNFLSLILWTDPAHREEARRSMLKAIELAPGASEYHALLSSRLSYQGDFAEAAHAAEQEPLESYRLWAKAVLGFLSGDRVGGQASLTQLEEKYGERVATYVARGYAAAGNLDQAFRWIDRAEKQGDSALAWAKLDLAFVPLRKDPRWPALLRRLNLPPDY